MYRENHALDAWFKKAYGEEWVLKILRFVQETGDFHNEEVWRSAAVELGMKLTEQEILEWYHNGKYEDCGRQ